MRRTRGDGNCFYRAFGFAYLEQLLNDKEELARLVDWFVSFDSCLFPLSHKSVYLLSSFKLEQGLQGPA